MPTEPHTNVHVHLRGAARDAVLSLAADDGLTQGQAVVKLIEQAIEPVVEVSTPSDLQEYATAELLEELRQRIDASAKDEELGQAISRAQVAEAKVAQMRALVLDEVAG